jgi:hypothetical protein
VKKKNEQRTQKQSRKAEKQSKQGKRGRFIEGKKTGDQTHGVMTDRQGMYVCSIIILIPAVVKILPISVNYA